MFIKIKKCFPNSDESEIICLGKSSAIFVIMAAKFYEYFRLNRNGLWSLKIKDFVIARLNL